jgi:asparagine synthase (glutamine-hydrolysing)
MSSISAFWARDRVNVSQSLHERMQTAHAIYGPDRAFRWSDEHISLGGNIMRLLPEDIHDRQPLWSNNGSACLVADVRLDNRAELIRNLDIVHPEEQADSEILLAAWLRWGEACLDHIYGGFAFAVWNPIRRELFAARDHVGERPLFFAHTDDFFALASMPKGLLALPQLSAGVCEDQVADWLIGIPPKGRQSFFKGVETLPVGHLLRVTQDRLECRQYWHPSDAKPVRYKRDEEYAEALRELLDRATEARLRSPRGIGSHLSGGLDSASVTASAALLLDQRGQRLTAFTAVPRPDFNGKAMPWDIASEDAGAAEVARCFPNLDHVLMTSAGYSLPETVKGWTDAMDEPVVHAANLLWLSAIQDEARERGLGVMLEGRSGNGTISWESWAILSQLFREGKWGKLLRTVQSVRNDGDASYKASLSAATSGLVPEWLLRLLQPPQAFEPMEQLMLNPSLLGENERAERIEHARQHAAQDPRKEQIAMFELLDPGVGNAAVRAMAHLDPRDPTADKRIYDFCFGIPQEQYIVGGHWRSLVRRAMKGRLPDATVNLYSKRGRQGADWYLPVGEALPELRTELTALEESPVAKRVLDLPKLGRLLETWPGEGYETSRVNAMWNVAMTRGFNLGYFLLSHEATVDQKDSIDPINQIDQPREVVEGPGSAPIASSTA